MQTSRPRPPVAALTARARVVVLEVHRNGAEGLGHRQALRDRVHGEDARRAGRLRDLHRAEADGPQAEHRGAVADHQPGMAHRVVAGAHHVAGEERDVVGHALGHAPQRQVRVRHEHPLGLRALEAAQRGAMAEGPRLVALVVPAAQAEEARPAGGLKAAQHPVADRHAGHVVARGEHRPDVLVADREAGLDLHAAVVDVQVRAAHAGRLDGDDRVVGGQQLGLGPLLEADLAGGLERDGEHVGSLRELGSAHVAGRERGEARGCGARGVPGHVRGRPARRRRDARRGHARGRRRTVHGRLGAARRAHVQPGRRARRRRWRRGLAPGRDQRVLRQPAHGLRDLARAGRGRREPRAAPSGSRLRARLPVDEVRATGRRASGGSDRAARRARRSRARRTTSGGWWRAGSGFPPPSATGARPSPAGRAGTASWPTTATSRPGSGALFVDGTTGWLGMGATMPDHRRKGAQGAILAARIAAAADAGCDVVLHRDRRRARTAAPATRIATSCAADSTRSTSVPTCAIPKEAEMADQVSKAVLVTGCSSGIGHATAEQLARAGWTVYATARRVDAIADLEAAGCRLLALDVTDEASMSAAVRAVEEAEGAVGVLVNNAGYSQSGVVEEVPLDVVRRQFETNVFGLVRMCQLVLPGMRRQRWGRIVNVSSMGGKLTFPGGGFYHGTKHAVEAISDALRWEVQGFGVDVVVIEPGLIKTSFGEVAAASIGDATPAEGPYAEFNTAVATATEGAYEGGGCRGSAVAPRPSRRRSRRRSRRGRPKTRYRVTASARLFMGQRRLMSDRMWDRMLRLPVQAAGPLGLVVVRTRRSPRRSGGRGDPRARGGAAAARRGSAPRGTRRRARRARPSTWSRPIASAQRSGPRGWLRPSSMPASMSSARADALAQREGRLVDELADDPAEHEPGRVADPLDVLAQRA